MPIPGTPFAHLILIQPHRPFGVLQALLEGAPWEPAERTILEAAGVIGRGEATVERETLLLVWLRHVASNLVQSPGDARNWIWTGRNVDSILRLV